MYFIVFPLLCLKIKEMFWAFNTQLDRLFLTPSEITNCVEIGVVIRKTRNLSAIKTYLVVKISLDQDPGSTSILGGRGAWPQILPLKFLLEPQILPPKI